MKSNKPAVCLICLLATQNVTMAQTLFTPGATVGASGTSSVGIGTSSPTAPLTIEAGTTFGPLSIANDNNTYIALGSWKNSGGHDYRIGIDGGTMWFGANSGYRWYRTATGTADMVLANGFLGIGTSSPQNTLHVASPVSTGNYPFILLENTSGANANSFGPGIVLMNHVVGTHGFILQQRQDARSYFSIANISAPYTDFLAIDQTGNVGIGTNTPKERLSVDGTIRAKEVIVETSGWSDYVLATDYPLEPLAAVEQHIKAHGTLPGMPSEKELATSGIGLGEMQAKLLAKIEELTLHQIEQEKEIGRLKQRLAQLEH